MINRIIRRRKKTVVPSQLGVIDVLNEKFFEEGSMESGSDESGSDLKPERLDFSTSGDDESGSEDKSAGYWGGADGFQSHSGSGSEMEKEEAPGSSLCLIHSDVEMRSSDEEQLLNFYDKNLREKVALRKTNAQRGEPCIVNYMKKMRAEEKKIVSQSLVESEMGSSENRSKKKEEILKKYNYRPSHFKEMSEVAVPKSGSSGGESFGDDSDLELDYLTNKISTMRPGKFTEEGKKRAVAREGDMRKKLAEMRKMVCETDQDYIEEQLAKAKERVANWIKEEENKSEPFMEQLKSSSRPKKIEKPRLSHFKNIKEPEPDLKKTISDIKKVLPAIKSKKPTNSIGPLSRSDINALLDTSKTQKKAGLARETASARKPTSVVPPKPKINKVVTGSRLEPNKKSTLPPRKKSAAV